MNIASMTGFARVQGCFQTDDENITWTWELKSVNGKNLDIKFRLPFGFDELMFPLKTKAANYLSRGSVSANLELLKENKTQKIKIDEVLLKQLAEKAIDLSETYAGKVTLPSASELLSQRGVIEIEDTGLSEEHRSLLFAKIEQSFEETCLKLQNDRRTEGEKINKFLQTILKKIATVITEIEKISADLPQKLKNKLSEQLKEYAADITVSEDRLAQEIVLLITRADIREEIDRLKTHLKSAENLLKSSDAVGRRLDFLCQELNREANTTCSKAMDISLTNLGMDLKALIEQFREQVQNIE